MIRYSSILLILIAVSLLGRIAVGSFAPGLAKFALASATTPSDWSEESTQEDEQGEEDKFLGGTHAWCAIMVRDSTPGRDGGSVLPDLSQEILVPPPQG